VILALDPAQWGLLGTGAGAFLTAVFGGYAAWSANNKAKIESGNSVAVQRVDQALNALGETVETLREEVNRCVEREVGYIAQLSAETTLRKAAEQEKRTLQKELDEVHHRLDQLERPHD